MMFSAFRLPNRTNTVATAVLALLLSAVLHALILFGLPTWRVLPEPTDITPPPNVKVQFEKFPKPSKVRQRERGVPQAVKSTLSPAVLHTVTPRNDNPAVTVPNNVVRTVSKPAQKSVMKSIPEKPVSPVLIHEPASTIPEQDDVKPAQADALPSAPVIMEGAVASPQQAPVLPTTITLAYVVNWKNMDGEATYTLWNDGAHYRITFQAKGTGLSELFGSMTMQSEGRLDADGLHPEHFWKERSGRQEVYFDGTSDGHIQVTFSSGRVLTVPGGLRAFDPLALVLQFYFSPPEAMTRDAWMATSWHLELSHFKKESSERLEVQGHQLDTEVWADYDDKGVLQRKLWLAPKYYYMPVQIYDYTNGTRVLRLKRLGARVIHT